MYRLCKLIAILQKATEPAFKNVVLIFENNSRSEYIIREDELETFLKASIKLHYSPGLNPHNKKRTAILTSIKIGSLVPTGPFWWSTANLKENNNPGGAKIWEWGKKKELWKDGNFLIPLP